MKIIHSSLDGVKLIEPNVFEDHRGYFYESYNKNTFKNLGIYDDFKQDNQSYSKHENTIRGLHFQDEPFSQSKLVRVLQGSVMDVVVNINPRSKFFGQWEDFYLSNKNKHMLYIPHGFAHGFQTLEDNTVFVYKNDNYYSKEHENSILWNDDDLNIPWCEFRDGPIISDKDKEAKSFKEYITWSGK